MMNIKKNTAFLQSGKKLAVLAASLMVFFVTALPVMAEHTDVNGTCSFDGKKINSDYTSELADAVTSLQPGDDVSFSIRYRNDYSKPTDWYMENEILQTLEKASANRISGVGTAEHGAYTYELIHVDKNGVRTLLFSNEEVGGDAVAGGMEGLEQATNALDEWFYIETLNQGEAGQVVLNVAFDGETQVNDYMDTNGGLAVRFAVEIDDTPTPTPGPSGTPTPTPTTPPGTPGNPGLPAVKTGDPTNAKLLFGMLIAGIVLLIVALCLRKRESDKYRNGTGGDAE